MSGPIYKPSGRAGEYAKYALNIYNGCSHGCTYCFAPSICRKDKVSFTEIKPTKNVLNRLREQLKNDDTFKGESVHLCFLCDPYPRGYDNELTDEIIDMLHEAGTHVQILTKAGKEIENRLLRTLNNEDSFGVTITCSEKLRQKAEPFAAPVEERLALLHSVKTNIPDIHTWVSLEPVYEPEYIYELIRKETDIDLFKIGKLNYHPSDINWAEFGHNVEALCKEYSRNFLLKQDLRACMKMEELSR